VILIKLKKIGSVGTLVSTLGCVTDLHSTNVTSRTTGSIHNLHSTNAGIASGTIRTVQ